MEAQTKVVWSLQLKLHVSGEPGSYAKNVFDSQSPTFFAGQIGSHRHTFTDTDYAIFKKLCRRTKVLNNIDLMGSLVMTLAQYPSPNMPTSSGINHCVSILYRRSKRYLFWWESIKVITFVEYNNVSYGIPQSLGVLDI